MSMELYASFLNPAKEYRGKPFWSWNGKLEKEELLRQIHVMKEMGFGGFFMHSRTGLETEYLGEDWFDLINACADEAERLGMEAWLYDEDRWPSGIAGGMVTETPAYRMKSIKLTIVNDSEEFSWEEDILAAFACTLKDLEVYGCKRIFPDMAAETYRGKQILVFKIIEMSRHSFYNGYTYMDTLNREATERFLELTHEKYRKKCGTRLGRSIKGIFTDEPHRGTLMDEFGAGNDGDIWRAPWTPLLPVEFQKRYGYDIIENLPALFLRYEGKNVSQVKWHYVELLQQLFLENFAKPIQKWCTRNNVLLTGHVLHEDSLTAQTAMDGSVMRYYEYMDYPGVDLLTEDNRAYWIVKQLTSTARQLGKTWLLSEMYGCTGWQMNFESHKAVGDWQALFGINLRCHHLSWYTMKGEAKRDYPASILHQSTWWKEYKYVEDYFSRIGLLMSQGQPCCDVLVINPVESVWCQVHPGWAEMLEAKAPWTAALEEKYSNLFLWLTEAHIDFDYGDEAMISQYYQIIRDEEGRALLKIGKAAYRTVVVGGMTVIRSSTLDILSKFLAQGGKVIIAGNLPTHVDAVEHVMPQAILDLAEKVSFTKESLTGAVSEHTSCRIEVLDIEGKNIGDIFCQVRDTEEGKTVMFLNTNRKKGYAPATIRMNLPGNVEEWVCSSGKRFAVTTAVKEGYIEFPSCFAPCQEHIYVIRQEKDPSLSSLSSFSVKEEYPLPGPYAYTLDEPNVCVLDMARYRINEGEWQEEQEILKIDQAVRKQFDLPYRGGEMLQPWFVKRRLQETKGSLLLAFDFYADYLPEGQIWLALEQPEHFDISINGQRLSYNQTTDWWVDKCFRKIPIPAEALRTGTNTIELKICFHEGVMLEAIYLLGQFGVKLQGTFKTLVSLPEKVFSSDLTKQGLPFYSGKIRYQMKLPEIALQEEKAYINIGSFEAACIKVISECGPDRMIAWQPYEADITEVLGSRGKIEVEAVLTRRNTFGPLHQVPIKVPFYGPENFVTTGDSFTQDYMLIPSGLLKEPVIKIGRIVPT